MRRECKCGKTDLKILAVIPMADKDTVRYENLVKAAAWAAMRETFPAIEEGLMTGPIRLTAKFYFQIPPSRQRRLKEGDLHSQKPDLSNCVKAIEDGMNEVVYTDDSQVTQHVTGKFWSLTPRAEIEVETLL